MAKGQITREIIRKEALKLFMQKGYSNSSLQDIIERSKVTKGGLFYHFPGGKEELYKACLDEYFTFCGPPEWMKSNAAHLQEQLTLGFEDILRGKEEIMQLTGCQTDQAVLMFHSFLYEATRKYPEFQHYIDKYDDTKHKALEIMFIKAQETGEIRNDLNVSALAIELDALLQQLLYLAFVNHKIKSDFNIIRNIGSEYYKRLIPCGTSRSI